MRNDTNMINEPSYASTHVNHLDVYEGRIWENHTWVEMLISQPGSIIFVPQRHFGDITCELQRVGLGIHLNRLLLESGTHVCDVFNRDTIVVYDDDKAKDVVERGRETGPTFPLGDLEIKGMYPFVEGERAGR